MISIAIATYNGEKFIKEQLDSIFNQTILPDEIVICDDNSNDNTLNIVNEYKDRNIPLVIVKNKINQGYKKNFYNAIKKCRGDFIFLCDQDDIWKNDKLESMISIMKDDNNILLLCSNLKPFYVENCKNTMHWKHIFSIKKVKRLNKYKNFVNTLRPGCTFCISKSLAKIYIDNVDLSIFHDNLLWHLANIYNGAYILNRQTMLYRRHSLNASNNKVNSVEKRKNAINEQIKSLNYIIGKVQDYKIKSFMRKQKSVFEKRLQYIAKKNIFGLLFLIRYLNYYNSTRLWLVDLYYCIKEM